VTARLELTALPGVKRVRAGDDLTALCRDALAAAAIDLRAGDALVLAQKIVSKAEGRSVRLADVAPSPRAGRVAREIEKDPRLVELILSEASEVVRTRPGLIIVRHKLGLVMANAGIDASNVDDDGCVLLLPVDPDRSAAAIRAGLGGACAVLIIDSVGRAWRSGTVGLAIGAAGLPTLLDLRGKPDLTGRPLQVTMVALADELAAAASLLMGQADEGRPIVHIRGLALPAGDGTARDLVRPLDLDLFR
jgi:coenzyme F420-0:L-glutamate ligase/coenzyme F420-1:gamma-L-glutamate ligase